MVSLFFSLLALIHRRIRFGSLVAAVDLFPVQCHLHFRRCFHQLRQAGVLVLLLLLPRPPAPGSGITVRCSSYTPSAIRSAADVSWIAVGLIAVIVVVPAVVAKVVAALPASVLVSAGGSLAVDFAPAAERYSDLVSCVAVRLLCCGTSCHKARIWFLVPVERAVLPFRFAWLYCWDRIETKDNLWCLFNVVQLINSQLNWKEKHKQFCDRCPSIDNCRIRGFSERFPPLTEYDPGPTIRLHSLIRRVETISC